MKNNLSSFTNQYQLSKSLRFELIPIGNTLENINNKGFLKKDSDRATSYQMMKKTIDGFHKYFIELSMKGVVLTHLDAYHKLYNSSAEEKKTDTFEANFKLVKEKLRKEIVKGFTSGEAKQIFAVLDKKELIQYELEKWIEAEQPEDIYFDEEFKKFTTYFSGFHQNRKNMYSDKEQSTAIAYRLIHENLPKFIDNSKTFLILKNTAVYDNLKTVYTDFESYLNVNTIDELFELNYFNYTLTQKDIEVYNAIIGGRSEAGKTKIKGINEYINLYNQQQKDKKNRIPKLKPLFKQILSDREEISFLPDAFRTDNAVLDAIRTFYMEHIECFVIDSEGKTIHVIEALKSLLDELANQEDVSLVYLRNDTHLTGVSQTLFGNYSVFGEALNQYYNSVINTKFEAEYQKASETKREKLDKEKRKFTHQSYLSIGLLQEAVEHYLEKLDHDSEIKNRYTKNGIASYFSNFFKAKKEEGKDKEFDFKSNIEAKYSAIKGILNTNYPSDKKLQQDQLLIDNIKLFLDAILEVLHFIKPLHLASDEISEKDKSFYANFDILYNELNLLTPLYNMVRNYVTQKPYSLEKYKLNFDNVEFLNGWDENKIHCYLTSILRKDEKYYLAVTDKKHNKVLKNTNVNNDKEVYRKMHYKQLAGAFRMLPKVFFSAKNIAYYNPSKTLLENYKNKTHIKGENFSLKDCHALIDFFKDSINKHEDWKHFDFKFSETKTYEDLSGFYREVEHQGYKVKFNSIDSSYIDQLVADGKLYLFQIYNKDFSQHSKGTPNMHTMYWKALFEEQNLNDVVYKLNGQAELFYRKSSIKETKITHPANQPIKTKNPLATKKESIFKYDLIKDKRFRTDKFQFHVPITMNFKATGNEKINNKVLEYLKDNPEVKIIGLDRGERHLIYLTLIDQKGNILKQESLNTINSDNYPITTDYHYLLQNREDELDNARKNWGTIENIKNLKEGYLSQVVHKIATMMVEENAIVVMEDLNGGFINSRKKVEKQVYQKLEKALIDKLNYLVFKNKDKNEPGGLYQALQLTNKFTSFKEIGKQSGFLFYVPAWNTSKIDPVTGFVNLFSIKYENVAKAQEFFNKMERIAFNENKKYFEFQFDYKQYTTRADETKTHWTVCTHGERITTFRNPAKNNQWDNQTIDLTQAVITLFNHYKIDYKQKDLKQIIINQTDKAFYQQLLHLFKLTLQMRNSATRTTIDYLISPVADSNGNFFDSRTNTNHLPKDADANGAYHIAKKGLWILEQINQAEDLKKLKLAITNKQWLQFVQQ